MEAGFAGAFVGADVGVAEFGKFGGGGLLFAIDVAPAHFVVHAGDVVSEIESDREGSLVGGAVFEDGDGVDVVEIVVNFGGGDDDGLVVGFVFAV